MAWLMLKQNSLKLLLLLLLTTTATTNILPAGPVDREFIYIIGVEWRGGVECRGVLFFFSSSLLLFFFSSSALLLLLNSNLNFEFKIEFVTKQTNDFERKSYLFFSYFLLSFAFNSFIVN